jgi:lysophospholipid acyltransferase
MQTLQRLVRTTVRPLFIPPLVPGAAQPGAKKHEPPPTLIKRLYDLAGTASTILVLNYAVIPFILLDWQASIQGWHRAMWYGHAAVFVPLLFFWSGGSRWLRKLQAARSPKLQMPATNGLNGGPPSGLTPGPHVVAPVHVVANEVEKKL